MTFIRCHISLLLIGAFALAVMSCKDDQVDQAPEPVIKSALIQYVEPDMGNVGSRREGIIKLSFQFHDADADLGFDWNRFASGSVNYFLHSEDGKMTPVSYSDTLLGDHSFPVHILNVPTPSTGKLMTARTTSPVGFVALENKNFMCGAYPYEVCHLLIRSSDRSVMRDDQRPLEVVLSGKTFYSLTDTLYWQENPDASNLRVQFLEVNAGNVVDERNWLDTRNTSFNTRIPDIAGLEFGKRIQMGVITVTGFSSTDGLIEYRMASTDFRKVFTRKKIRLRVTVIDKAGHVSNVIESNDVQF